MQPLTIESLRNIINNQMESEFPDELLAALKEKEGKRFDKRVVDFLRAKFPDKNFCKTERFNHDSISYSGCESGLTMYYGGMEHTGTINTQWIEEHNIAYFKARRERNAGRLALLADEYSMEEIVRRHNAMITAFCEYKLAEEQYKETYRKFDGVYLEEMIPNQK